MRKTLWIAALPLVAALAWAQALPPGQLPPGPPPQPGQLGPAPEKVPAGPTPEKETPANPNPTPQIDGSVIHVGVRNVLVPTTVLDPDGHGYVNGLDVSDFTVLDNGKPQKVSAEVIEQPMSVVLVVQANSEVEPLLPVIRKSGILLHSLVTGVDGEVAILAFDHRMRVMQQFTSDPNKIDDAMGKITAGSSTAAMIDAVMQADRMLKQRDQSNARRRVIVLMSRNQDKGSQIKIKEAVHQMQFDNVIVYCVDISRVKTALLKSPDYPRPANGGVPPEAMGNITGRPLSQTDTVTQMDGNWLSAVPPLFHNIEDLFRRTPAESFAYFTGGNVYGFSTQHGLEAAITDIGKDLNSQYLLSYAPTNSNEPGFHTIQVVVDRPGLKIRTRPGYWWGGGQTQ